ncbi:MAG: acyltransferase [Rhizobiales bacterium]|nr:acyltransferase [Hyphomicrobiales bacterium]
MRLLGVIAGATLRGSQGLSARLKTLHAQHTCTIGQGTRFTATGEAVNIAGAKNRIVIGNECVIGGQILVFAHAGRIRIGDLVFVGCGSHIWSSADLVIGDRVLISHYVEIHDTESHPLASEARAEQTRAIIRSGHPSQIEGVRASPVVIGNDVWIGFGATIRRGVTIGDRAIIGARAIVDRDVPADGMVKAIAQ